MRVRRFSFWLLAGLILLTGLPGGRASARQDPVRAERGRAAQADTDTSRRVEPGPALLRSAVLPGWGQFYTRHPVKGGLMMAAQVAFIGMAVRADGRVKDLAGLRNSAFPPSSLEDDIESWRSERRSWIIRAFGLWLYSMADAYVDAHLHHFDEEEPQFEFSTVPPRSTTVEKGFWLGFRIMLGRPDR